MKKIKLIISVLLLSIINYCIVLVLTNNCDTLFYDFYTIDFIYSNIKLINTFFIILNLLLFSIINYYYYDNNKTYILLIICLFIIIFNINKIMLKDLKSCVTYNVGPIINQELLIEHFKLGKK